MKNRYSLLLLLAAYFLPSNAYSQCDTLLNASAIDLITCENETLGIDLAALEVKKGGKWASSENGSFANTTVNTMFSKSQYIVYTYTNPKKTCTESDSFFIKVNSKPTITTKRPAHVCANEPCFDLSFTASPLGGVWFDTNPNSKYLQNGQFCPSAEIAQSTIVTRIVSYAYEDANGCKDTAANYITIKPLPENDLRADTAKHCLKKGKLNLDSFSFNTRSVSLSWSGDGVVTSGGVHYFDNDEVGKKEGDYTLVLKSTDKEGGAPNCSRFDTMVVKLENCLVSNLPNPTSESFSVFPNPSTRDVQLSHSENFTYKVFSMNGVLLEKSEQPVKNAHLEMEDGVYWVVITNTSGHMESQKVIVEE